MTQPKRKAHTAVKRKPSSTRPPSNKKIETEYSSAAGFLLTNRNIPNTLAAISLANWQSGTAMYMYPRADDYSPNGRPLEFGVALGLLPIKHTGQIFAIKLRNDDATVPVEIEEIGVVTNFQEIQQIWEGIFDEVWEFESTKQSADEVLLAETKAATDSGTQESTTA